VAKLPLFNGEKIPCFNGTKNVVLFLAVFAGFNMKEPVSTYFKHWMQATGERKPAVCRIAI
jgi:hypothetical protein